MLTSIMVLVAAASVAPASQSPEADSARDQEVVCKSERRVGSNLGSRTCKTREKWAEDRRQARDGLIDGQTRGRLMQTPCMNGGSVIGGNCGSGSN